MNWSDRGVLVVVLEFVLSLVILVGGGFLLHDHPDQTTLTLVSSAIGAVIPFWFMRRQNDTTQQSQFQQAVQQAVAEALKQSQQPAPPAQAPAQSAQASAQPSTQSAQSAQQFYADPIDMKKGQ